jgi:hypothetical protein
MFCTGRNEENILRGAIFADCPGDYSFMPFSRSLAFRRVGCSKGAKFFFRKLYDAAIFFTDGYA